MYEHKYSVSDAQIIGYISPGETAVQAGIKLALNWDKLLLTMLETEKQMEAV